MYIQYKQPKLNISNEFFTFKERVKKLGEFSVLYFFLFVKKKLLFRFFLLCVRLFFLNFYKKSKTHLNSDKKYFLINKQQSIKQKKNEGKKFKWI